MTKQTNQIKWKRDPHWGCYDSNCGQFNIGKRGRTGRGRRPWVLTVNDRREHTFLSLRSAQNAAADYAKFRARIVNDKLAKRERAHAERAKRQYVCPLCSKKVKTVDTVSALFVGKICRPCENKFKRTNLRRDYVHPKLWRYVRDIESGFKRAPFGCRVTLKGDGNVVVDSGHSNGQEPVVLNDRLIPLTKAGNVSKSGREQIGQFVSAQGN